VTAAPFVVTHAEGGRTLAAVLKARLRLSWSQARLLVERRRVRVNGRVIADPAVRVKAGQRVAVIAAPPKTAGRSKPANSVLNTPYSVPPGVVVHYADDAVAVVEKPPGLTTMRHAGEAAEFGARGQRFLPRTLADILPQLLPGGGRPRAVHRIDKETSGLVVFARSPDAERHLGRQFRAHTIARRYLAITRGRPPEGRIESWLVRDRGDGRPRSGPPGHGQRAVTHVRVLEEFGRCALVECRLETGRTHQVRIHLGEAGAPLAGEMVYDRPPHGRPAADASGAPRVALHAALLGFTHPVTGEWMEWESPLPADLEAVVRRLRSQKS
jgi:23S rRNA pseudouridine1911/1915/1917 synthase